MDNKNIQSKQPTVYPCTSIEQSEMLKAFLPIESTDMCYRWHDERWYCVPKDVPYPYSLKDIVNSWSLTALLNAIPGDAELMKINSYEYMVISGFGQESIICNNPIDACVDLLVKLHEQNFLHYGNNK